MPSETTIDPLLVDRVTAAVMLNICPRTLDGMAARGEVPRVTFGRAVRFDIDDLRALIASKKKGELVSK